MPMGGDEILGGERGERGQRKSGGKASIWGEKRQFWGALNIHESPERFGVKKGHFGSSEDEKRARSFEMRNGGFGDPNYGGKMPILG